VTEGTKKTHNEGTKVSALFFAASAISARGPHVARAQLLGLSPDVMFGCVLGSGLARVLIVTKS
jgi:hypothetical protein